jgi:sec-independent protein translocase protein TatA
MFANLSGWHALVILAIVLLLFGAPKLPALARSVGQSLKILQKEVKTSDRDGASSASSTEEISTPSSAMTSSSPHEDGR